MNGCSASCKAGSALWERPGHLLLRVDTVMIQDEEKKGIMR